MKVIIHSKDDDDLILAVRAVKIAKQQGRNPSGMTIIEYEDGSIFQVRWNKFSMAVWAQGASR